MNHFKMIVSALLISLLALACGGSATIDTPHDEASDAGAGTSDAGVGLSVTSDASDDALDTGIDASDAGFDASDATAEASSDVDASSLGTISCRVTTDAGMYLYESCNGFTVPPTLYGIEWIDSNGALHQCNRDSQDSYVHAESCALGTPCEVRLTLTESVWGVCSCRRPTCH